MKKKSFGVFWESSAVLGYVFLIPAFIYWIFFLFSPLEFSYFFYSVSQYFSVTFLLFFPLLAVVMGVCSLRGAFSKKDFFNKFLWCFVSLGIFIMASGVINLLFSLKPSL